MFLSSSEQVTKSAFSQARHHSNNHSSGSLSALDQASLTPTRGQDVSQSRMPSVVARLRVTRLLSLRSTSAMITWAMESHSSGCSQTPNQDSLILLPSAIIT